MHYTGRYIFRNVLCPCPSYLYLPKGSVHILQSSIKGTVSVISIIKSFSVETRISPSSLIIEIAIKSLD